MSGGSSEQSATGVSVVFVTVPSSEVGRKIAHSLVESKLAACVQIIPGLESVYFWEGRVQSDPELLLKIKTARALVPELTAAVRAQHPYDEPEVVALDAAGGSESYLKAPPHHHRGLNWATADQRKMLSSFGWSSHDFGRFADLGSAGPRLRLGSRPGLAVLAERVLGASPPKSREVTLSDRAAPSLSSEQIRYAALDALLVWHVHHRLHCEGVL